jgi:ketosteroid isomerase-like protein
MARATRKSVHTVPRGKGWATKSGGRTVGVHRKKTTAEAAGRQVAKKRHAEHVIHNRNGRIGESNSYGGDPHPPQG